MFKSLKTLPVLVAAIAVTSVGLYSCSTDEPADIDNQTPSELLDDASQGIDDAVDGAQEGIDSAIDGANDTLNNAVDSANDAIDGATSEPE